LVGALAVMLVTFTLAHGPGLLTLAASLGTAASLVLTVALAWLAARLAHLSGISSDETVILHQSLPGLSLEGLLLAGATVAALGVIVDVTVSQASTVLALRQANDEQTTRELVRGAMRVGRDHIAATVNTLVYAYVGASLPILLI